MSALSGLLLASVALVEAVDAEAALADAEVALAEADVDAAEAEDAAADADAAAASALASADTASTISAHLEPSALPEIGAEPEAVCATRQM